MALNKRAQVRFSAMAATFKLWWNAQLHVEVAHVVKATQSSHYGISRKGIVMGFACKSPEFWRMSWLLMLPPFPLRSFQRAHGDKKMCSSRVITTCSCTYAWQNRKEFCCELLARQFCYYFKKCCRAPWKIVYYSERAASDVRVRCEHQL